MAYQNMPAKPDQGDTWTTWGDSADANLREVISDVPSLRTQVSGLSSTVSGHTTQISSLTSEKADLSALSTVATTGNYVDLIGAPTGGSEPTVADLTTVYNTAKAEGDD